MSLYIYGCNVPFKVGDKVILLYKKDTYQPKREIKRIILFGRIDTLSQKVIQKMPINEVHSCTSDTVKLMDGTVYWTSQVCKPGKFKERLQQIAEREGLIKKASKKKPANPTFMQKFFKFLQAA